MAELTIFDWLLIVYVVFAGLGLIVITSWGAYIIVKYWQDME